MIALLGRRAGTSGLERLIVGGGTSTSNVGLRIGFWRKMDDDTAEQVLIIKFLHQKIRNQRPKFGHFFHCRISQASHT